MSFFKLTSNYNARGDQPRAIKQLSSNIQKGVKNQTLLGVTGSGKTYTIASVISQVQRPTLVISHNKTLAAQLYSEFKNFFPENSVEYFVSYYDYYQPEAYIPTTDTYIDKDTSINDEIERLRLSATTSLISKRDVIVVASVSCIYGLGEPESIRRRVIYLEKGQKIKIKEVIRNLINLQYERNDLNFVNGTIRVKGDVLDIYPAYGDSVIRVDFFGDEIERISAIDPINLNFLQEFNKIGIYPAKHFIIEQEEIESIVKAIEKDLEKRENYFEANNKKLEAYRLRTRVKYDIEMIRETGYCSGIENYSLYLSGRKPGEPPYTLIDYFPKDFLTIIDESHMTIPQIEAMYGGDHSRKKNLIEYGFRLPTAYDNRPLTLEEFENRINQVVYVSATPALYELKKSNGQIVEQIIRPTGLIDPIIEVKPAIGQVDDLLNEINNVIKRNERVLVTTLTKRMAEDLTEYLIESDIKSRYLHSEIDTIERVEIIRDLRKGKFDVLVGINLLREGLDLPEVSLIGILDADKQGFLRSTRALIQTIGRAARNVNGKVIMYADKITKDMKQAINETNRRREIQMVFNEEHNIEPESISKEVRDLIERIQVEPPKVTRKRNYYIDEYDKDDLSSLIDKLEKEMNEAAIIWEFERAAMIRDEILRLKEYKEIKGGGISNIQKPKKE